MKWKTIILGILKWSLLAAYLIITLSFVANRYQQVVCAEININISDSLENAFVTKGDVIRIIERHHKNLIGIPLWMINTHELEQKLKETQTVKRAEVYSANDGSLNVHIEQRKPMVRIINRKNQSYYIDSDGQILPLSSKFTSHVLIVNGNIVEPFDVNPNIRLKDWAKNNSKESVPLICQLYDFARFINENSFWKAQISQVYVESPTHIELIPRVGAHTILLGSLDGYQKKLRKLRIFYETALPEEGWNKYKQINLKYRNQIVCTKK